MPGRDPPGKTKEAEMAVAIEMNFKGATLEQYDQVMKLMSLDGGSRPVPPGALFHWVARTDDGIRVVDVWETKEQFDAFAEKEIGPYSQQVGIPAPPETRITEVHNYLER
jgi:hypothetical protein